MNAVFCSVREADALRIVEKFTAHRPSRKGLTQAVTVLCRVYSVTDGRPLMSVECLAHPYEDGKGGVCLVCDNADSSVIWESEFPDGLAVHLKNRF